MEQERTSFSPSFDDTTTLMTVSGNEINLTNPDPKSISLYDIAHGLSQQCRSAGQTIRFYSVGLHSIYVAEELERIDKSPEIQLVGLLHDAAEAYLSDVPAPVKKHLDGYARLETKMENTIWTAFDLESPDESTYGPVKAVDRYLREYEFATISPHFAENTSPPDLPYDLEADEKIDVKDRFIEFARELSAKSGADIPE